MRRIIAITLLLIGVAGCTMNIYLLPGVKTDIKADLRRATSQPSGDER